jgi:hypothetical protein
MPIIFKGSYASDSINKNINVCFIEAKKRKKALMLAIPIVTTIPNATNRLLGFFLCQSLGVKIFPHGKTTAKARSF